MFLGLMLDAVLFKDMLLIKFIAFFQFNRFTSISISDFFSKVAMLIILNAKRVPYQIGKNYLLLR